MKYNDNGTWKDIPIKASDTLPIGFIGAYPKGVCPSGWLLCHGQNVSRTEYAELFAIIGTMYGDGDGSTTFTLPKYDGKVLVGLDEFDEAFDTIGKTGGEKTHKLIANEIPPLNVYTANDVTGGNIAYLRDYDGYTGGGLGVTPIGKTKLNDNVAHNNVQPYVVVDFIIKAKQSVGVIGKVLDIFSTSTTDTYNCAYINGKFEEQKGRTLYSGNTAGNVTLSDNINNYSYIDVIWKNTIDNCNGTERVYKGFGAFKLKHINIDNQTLQIFNTKYSVSGTTITKGANYYSYLLNGGQMGHDSSSNYFAIQKVVGYK